MIYRKNKCFIYKHKSIKKSLPLNIKKVINNIIDYYKLFHNKYKVLIFKIVLMFQVRKDFGDIILRNIHSFQKK